jgi:hypothetical protein
MKERPCCAAMKERGGGGKRRAWVVTGLRIVSEAKEGSDGAGKGHGWLILQIPRDGRCRRQRGRPCLDN